MFDKLSATEQRYEELGRLMAEPELATDFVRLHALAKERSSIEEVVTRYREWRALRRSLQEAQGMVETEKDPELLYLARDEVASLESHLAKLEGQLRLLLVPKDPDDDKDVIVEIRAGTGGDEAALFASDLYRLYGRYAQSKGWEAEVIDSSPTGIGGFKEIIFEVRGKGAFSRLKYERGVHRVQRVPETEASGRIHTSTATVAVLPEADEVELKVDPSELRIDIFHASGHGGQNVQKVATAVRVVHIPTGITAVCQDERSQLKNRQKAMAVLRARLLDLETRRREEEVSAARRSQVGSGERAEKIRTYNFPQDRVTDHRIGLTLHNLPSILEGNLDPIIDPLLAEEQSRRLAEATA